MSRKLLLALAIMAALAVGGTHASPGATKRVSVDSGGRWGKGGSSNPAISADGRFAAFASPAATAI
jgi:hypothetical protein